MNMIETLDAIDKQWILALNNDYSSFWDMVMFATSQVMVWIPLYLSIVYVAIRSWRKEGWIIVISLVISVIVADQVASGLLKNWIARPRPTHDLAIGHLIVTVNDYIGGQYGFVSSHAANTFALALCSSLFFKRWQYATSIFLWATLNAYSRVYLGVHYVGDVVGGMLVGLMVGWGVYWMARRLKRKSFVRKATSVSLLLFPIITLFTTFLFFLVWANLTASV